MLLITRILQMYRLAQIKRIRQHSRAWVADDGALVLLVKRG